MNQRDLHRTRIKLCGLSRVEDVQHAVALGADAVGFVFYPPSPRSVSVAQAVELARHVPPLVSAVGPVRQCDARVDSRSHIERAAFAAAISRRRNPRTMRGTRRDCGFILLARAANWA